MRYKMLKSAGKTVMDGVSDAVSSVSSPTALGLTTGAGGAMLYALSRIIKENRQKQNGDYSSPDMTSTTLGSLGTGLAAYGAGNLASTVLDHAISKAKEPSHSLKERINSGIAFAELSAPVYAIMRGFLSPNAVRASQVGKLKAMLENSNAGIKQTMLESAFNPKNLLSIGSTLKAARSKQQLLHAIAGKGSLAALNTIAVASILKAVYDTGKKTYDLI